MRHLLIFFVLFVNFLPFYSYSNENIELQISAFNEPILINLVDNEIYYTALPKSLSGQLSFQVNSLGTFYPSGINEKSCNLVRDRANNSMNSFFPYSVRSEQKNLVRKYGSVKLKFSIKNSFYSNSVKRKIIEKLNKKLNNNLLYSIKDNFQINEATLLIEYNKNAISNIIDNKEEINRQLLKLTNIKFLEKESFDIELSSSDFICDLYYENAKISLIYKQNNERHANIILNNYEKELIIHNINNKVKKYFDKNTLNSKDKNLILSAIFLNEVLHLINLNNIEINNYFKLLEKITDPDNGEIYNNLTLKNLELENEEVNSKILNYSGTVKFEVQKQNLKQTQ